jgi:hypothetical protein
MVADTFHRSKMPFARRRRFSKESSGNRTKAQVRFRNPTTHEVKTHPVN